MKRSPMSEMPFTDQLRIVISIFQQFWYKNLVVGNPAHYFLWSVGYKNKVPDVQLSILIYFNVRAELVSQMKLKGQILA